MENNMFCFQCQETAKGFGCTLKGVCGKNATTARTMDLLLFVVRGISVVADQLRQHSLPVEKEVDNFIVDALFCTITNANFDDESITKRIDKGLAIRDDLKHQASAKDIPLPEADELNWKGSHDEYDAKAATVGVLREQNEDLRSLKELIMYGLKGMAAYLEHAMRLGHNDESIHRFMQNTIAQITTKSLSADELTVLALRTGEIGVRTMALLDKANTSSYGNPEITHVNIGTGTPVSIADMTCMIWKNCWNKPKTVAWTYILTVKCFLHITIRHLKNIHILQETMEMPGGNNGRSLPRSMVLSCSPTNCIVPPSAPMPLIKNACLPLILPDIPAASILQQTRKDIRTILKL